MDVDEVWTPAKKDTTILTTKRSVAETMSRLCPGDHEHCRLEGYMKGHGVHRTSFVEEYQPAFSSTLAKALACAEKPQIWGRLALCLGKIVDLHAEGIAKCLSSCTEAPQCPGPGRSPSDQRPFHRCLVSC